MYRIYDFWIYRYHIELETPNGIVQNTILIEINIFQGLNPGRAIAEIKKLLGGVAKKEEPGLKATA